MLVDDGEDEPTHGDVCLGLLLAKSDVFADFANSLREDHKQPNGLSTNNRIELSQTTEQKGLKSPKIFNFLWWFAIKDVFLRPKQ